VLNWWIGPAPLAAASGIIYGMKLCASRETRRRLDAFRAVHALGEGLALALEVAREVLAAASSRSAWCADGAGCAGGDFRGPGERLCARVSRGGDAVDDTQLREPRCLDRARGERKLGG